MKHDFQGYVKLPRVLQNIVNWYLGIGNIVCKQCKKSYLLITKYTDRVGNRYVCNCVQYVHNKISPTRMLIRCEKNGIFTNRICANGHINCDKCGKCIKADTWVNEPIYFGNFALHLGCVNIDERFRCDICQYPLYNGWHCSSVDSFYYPNAGCR